eukprot:CAMPEP_0172014856 /NCGR_PEP_ID=MMETSP1041-20130122/10166_1 /TAXON_ID=464988 /ORGANISM="Hemiselmis andersenii, Strain CCMP439" /LENGTH=163 /DNA_ID=CAMNT_0012669671 /DNA_START=667 /DNA_END=1159 /DNA_ORIENTATION=+
MKEAQHAVAQLECASLEQLLPCLWRRMYGGLPVHPQRRVDGDVDWDGEAKRLDEGGPEDGGAALAHCRGEQWRVGLQSFLHVIAPEEPAHQRRCVVTTAHGAPLRAMVLSQPVQIFQAVGPEVHVAQLCGITRVSGSSWSRMHIEHSPTTSSSANHSSTPSPV